MFQHSAKMKRKIAQAIHSGQVPRKFPTSLKKWIASRIDENQAEEFIKMQRERERHLIDLFV